MAYNKFIKQDGTILLDLTGDTATESLVGKGVIFHKPDGTQAIGTCVFGGGDSIVVDVEEFPTENVDDGKIYRMSAQTTGNVYMAGKLVSEELEVMTIADAMSAAFSMAGSAVPVETPIYTVDILPENLEPMAFTDSGLILPCYVLNSTGIVYVNSGQGDAQTLGTMFSGVDGGWVLSAGSIVATDVMTVYAVRGGLNTAYGVPNDNDNKFVYEYSSKNGWVDVKKLFNDKIIAIQSELQTEVSSLKKQNIELLNEKESLENENSELTNKLENIFNIAYGDAEPIDTSKLWVKTTEPNNVFISPVKNEKDESVVTLDVTLPYEALDFANKVVLVNGKIYLHDTYCFDPVDSSITHVGTGYYGGRTKWSAVGQKIYIFNKTNTLHCLDTETMNTTNITFTESGLSYTDNNYINIPTPVAVGKNIYLFGGYTYYGYTSHTYCFDTETNVMTYIGGMPKAAKVDVKATALGTKIYMDIDGYIYYFDTETCTYSESLGTHPQHSCPCAANGSDVYWFDSYHKVIYKFDTITNTLDTIQTNLGNYDANAVAISVSDVIYLFGTRTDPSVSNSYKGVQYFNTAGNKVMYMEKNAIQIIPSLEKNIFRLTNDYTKSVEIGIDSVYKGDNAGIGRLVTAALYKDGAWVNI